MSFYTDTRCYASPVYRGDFSYYRDEFSVAIDGGRHRHARCGSSHLYYLLTYTEPTGPVLTKAGKVAKRQPPPHKDETSHFYEAQCVHYGLKPYKTKAAAKKHLLAAFDPVAKTLEVPSHIAAIESELKQEFTVANEAGRKARQEEKAKEEQERRAQAERVRIARENERARKLEEAGKMIGEFEAAGIIIAKGQVSDAKVRKPQAPVISDEQLRKDLAALSVAQLRSLVEKLVFDKPNPVFKKAISQEVSEMKKLQAGKAKGKAKKSSKKLLNDTFDNKGQYTIMAPYLRSMWEDTEDMWLKMSSSPGKSHHWVSFDFGIVSGKMRSFGSLPKHVGDTVQFHWKGAESGTGETTFGEENIASITFLGDGRIRGRMFFQCAGTFEFIGKKVPRDSNIVWSKSVANWKSEYRGINARSYEAANRSRWGGWYDPGDEGDLTPNSDTAFEDSDLGHSEDEDVDMDSEGGFDAF